MDRRTMLAAMAATTAGCVARPGVEHIPLAMTDATLRKELAKDYGGTLRRVAAMGYTHFGFRLSSFLPNDPNELPPAEKARLVREAGMEVGVVRLAVRKAQQVGQFEQAKAIGAKIIALTTAPVFIAGKLGTTTRAAFEAWLPELEAQCAAAREVGLVFAYHNHWYDFEPLDGVRPFDLMVERIGPRLLSFEVDLAWAWYGGQDPVALLERLGPRVVSMHLKDIDRSRGRTETDHAVEPGAGAMDYAALLPRIRATTHALGAVEVDSPNDGLAAAERGAAFVRRFWPA